MIQNILVIIVVSGAVLYALYRLISFIKRDGKKDCSPDRCKTCPYSDGTCSEAENQKQDQRFS